MAAYKKIIAANGKTVAGKPSTITGTYTRPVGQGITIKGGGVSNVPRKSEPFMGKGASGRVKIHGGSQNADC